MLVNAGTPCTTPATEESLREEAKALFWSTLNAMYEADAKGGDNGTNDTARPR